MDAMHPHDLQSGCPPNWHGLIRVCRSADKVSVVCAKMQSLGLAGGETNCWIKAAGMSSFEYCFRSCIISAVASARSAGASISGNSSPICGVNRLNHTFLISGRGVQNFRNSPKYPGRFII